MQLKCTQLCNPDMVAVEKLRIVMISNFRDSTMRNGSIETREVFLSFFDRVGSITFSLAGVCVMKSFDIYTRISATKLMRCVVYCSL